MKLQMKRILSIIVSLLFIIQAFLFFSLTASADSEASIVLTASTKQINPGAEVTVTLKYTCPVDTAYLYFNVYFDNDKLTFVPASGQAEAVGMINETIDPGRTDDSKSITLTYKFRAKTVGNAEIYVDNVENYRLDPVPDKSDSIETSTSSVTVSIVEKVNSSNANLRYIQPSEGTLTPAFNKDVTSYKVNVPNNVTKCYMDHGLEDKDAKSTISGNEFLEVGDNVRTITVTAADGTVKKYTVNVIRASAATNPPASAPTTTPAPTPADNTSTPETSGNTASPSASPADTPDASEIPTEFPDDTEDPDNTADPDDTSSPDGSDTESATPGGSAEDPSSDYPSTSPDAGPKIIGTFDVFDDTLVLYNISEFLDMKYPGHDILEPSNFICGGKILKGLRAYENKNTQYLIYASKNGADPEVYIMDVTDKTLQRYIGGEKIFEAYDITAERPPVEAPDAIRTTIEDGKYKYAVSEFVDRTIDFNVNNKLLFFAGLIFFIVLPLMVFGIVFTKVKLSKRG